MSSAWSGANTERTVPVSVILPCHNAGATVARAVASVAMQSVRPLEVIAIDDASTDHTRGVLRSLQSAFPAGWLRVLCQDANFGPASARNAGWDAARGQYVAFLDADDTWHPRKIELQHGFMSEHREYQLTGHAHRREHGDRPWVINVPTSGHDEIGFKALLFSNRFTTSSVMVRSDIPYRFLSGRRYMEDHLLWLTMICSGVKAARLRAQLSARFSAPYGEAGLSRHLVRMEGAEIANYWHLYRRGAIGAGWLAVLQFWSLVKFLRRGVLTGLRRALG